MLNVWDSKGVFFVIRHEDSLSFTSLSERELPTPAAQQVLKDEEIDLANTVSQAKYSGKLRRVAVWDDENKQTIELITNNFKWAAQTIADLYKPRWQVEVFFREIRQLLHIKTFIGTSKNAVMIQIWSALTTILLLKVMKAMAKYGWHLSNLVAFIRLNIFVKIDLKDWLDSTFEDHDKPPKNLRQGVLFQN